MAFDPNDSEGRLKKFVSGVMARLNVLALAALFVLIVWALVLMASWHYAIAVGHPPVSFDNDQGTVQATDLQRHVAQMLGVVQILSIPIAGAALGMAVGAAALPRERWSAIVVVAVSGASMIVSVAVAINGVFDIVLLG